MQQKTPKSDRELYSANVLRVLLRCKNRDDNDTDGIEMFCLCVCECCAFWRMGILVYESAPEKYIASYKIFDCDSGEKGTEKGINGIHNKFKSQGNIFKIALRARNGIGERN